MHKKKASTILDLVTNQNEDESLETEKVAMQIKSDIKNISGIKDKHPVLDEYLLTEIILPTLNNVLVTISPKFKDIPKSVALISRISSSTITNWEVSMLQVALGLLVREKKTIEYLQNHSDFLIWQSETIQDINDASCKPRWKIYAQ